MHNSRPHPLLEQVPLTVSPFVSLPTATTLSYNYKSMPSSIPPSGMGIPAFSDGTSPQPMPQFIVSNSGHAAHPDDIQESCRALLAHVTELQQNAEKELQEFDERIRQRDLAEKRRVAPGWLDSEARLLEPQRMGQQKAPNAQESQQPATLREEGAERAPGDDEGAQLDKAFGVMELK
ncbi:hypothetical protein E4U42_001182 [Claviceps africana]|uniref:Uncharacterized protein n=1 Tax=Claviceps africana TaxID=83212 RepID=A0A8K0J117_9HYPO|nr:hypothetical protein E4U42_001182 [Claviceps africana]